ncbi:MAG: hypothetical protein EZS28_056665, partial [Streblomastix strix]
KSQLFQLSKRQLAKSLRVTIHQLNMLIQQRRIEGENQIINIVEKEKLAGERGNERIPTSKAIREPIRLYYMSMFSWCIVTRRLFANCLALAQQRQSELNQPRLLVTRSFFVISCPLQFIHFRFTAFPQISTRIQRRSYHTC